MTHFDEAERFIALRPDIWARFCQLADERIAAGRTRGSARAFFYVIRGEYGELLNDHWSPHFARRWLIQHPDHPGFFELRNSDATPAEMPLFRAL